MSGSLQGESARIRKLDPTVVKRIAAGEIIVQPANALKELLENSLDAQSTMIDVLVKDGGIKLLQITDNGRGVSSEDMPLLCKRFTTSKLRNFEDLTQISTYGFRGEALASISHISRLTVVSKTRDSPIAYKCYYVNGQTATPKFKPDPGCKPQPVAGNSGTQISAEDLFYNASSRLQALRSKNDEWIKMLDVLGKYAVHSAGVGFSCKKFGEPHASISTRPLASLKERIRVVFGTAVASELVEFSFECKQYGLTTVRGAVSGFNYNNKRKIQPVFFINNRLVSCEPLKRAVNSVFHIFLPKGNHPFVYLSLDIEPENVDVNLHPTKREVRFLNEDEILQWVCGKIHDILSERENSRTFKQSVLKRSGDDAVDVVSNKKQRQENMLVRVDGRQQKIGAFVKADTKKPKFLAASPESARVDDAQAFEEEAPISETISTSAMLSSTSRKKQHLNLDSIAELRQEVAHAIDRPLSNVFNNLVYVGVVDARRRLCCFQYDVKLFLCDYGAVLAEFYYQLVLSGFSNFGELVLADPIPLRAVLEPLYAEHSHLIPIEKVIETLLGMQEMFIEYFQLDFSNGSLHMLPLILKDLQPSKTKLAYFIYRLGVKVNFNDEKECLRGISHEIALLYIPDRIEPERGEKAMAVQQRDELNSHLEHTVFPALKKKFIATEKIVPDVVQVADLPGLYRVFERC